MSTNSVRSIKTSGLSRREAVKLGVLGGSVLLATLVAPSKPANATETPLLRLTDDLTIGEMIRALYPDHWAQVDPEVQQMLLQAPMSDQAPLVQPRVGGSAHVTATDGFGSSQYDGYYYADEVCPTVACSVTYSRGGYIYASRGPVTENYTRWVSMSGAVSPDAGTYNVVLTSYPMQPPPGGTIEYKQAFDTATIYS